MRFSIRSVLVAMVIVAIYSTIAVKAPQWAIVLTAYLLSLACGFGTRLGVRRSWPFSTFVAGVLTVSTFYVAAFLTIVATNPDGPPGFARPLIEPFRYVCEPGGALFEPFDFFYGLCLD